MPHEPRNQHASTLRRIRALAASELFRAGRDGGVGKDGARRGYPTRFDHLATDFRTASKENEGKYALGAAGEVVDAKTGRQPSYLLGFPFPTIDPSDPAAGSKIVWNYIYRAWYDGNLRAQTQLDMMNREKLERRLDVDVRFFYYNGVAERERPAENPRDLTVQSMTVVESPADVHGTIALSWRYRDPARRDSSWTYVPAIRRVRQISPANRSDGFLGSDMSQDDGPFFDGKVEDFDWKLAGETKHLRVVDPLNLRGEAT
ncbi:MAG: DUF1329 domain-containing protein, partial [Gemmatimonadota bacterium]